MPNFTEIRQVGAALIHADGRADKRTETWTDMKLRSAFWGHENTPSRLRLKCDGTQAETRFRLSAKRTSPFKSAGASVKSTTGNRGVRISGSNAGYTTFRGSVKSTGYPLHSPVSPSLPLPCVTVFHPISTEFYNSICRLSMDKSKITEKLSFI